MTAYVVHAVLARDMAQPIPAWMQRVTIWAGGGKFAIHCDAALPDATDLLLEGLIYVLHRRGREAAPIMEGGEVRGMRW